MARKTGWVPQLIVAVVVVGLGILVATYLRRRDAGTMTQGARWSIPAQLERRDFVDAEAPRLVVVFSSDTCDACAATWQRVSALVGSATATATELVSYQARPDLHERYGIDAVPTLLVADAQGVVERSFVGPPDEAELAEVLSMP